MCSGRQSRGRSVCAAPSHVRADALEGWVLAKLQKLVLADVEGMEGRGGP